MMNFDDFLAQSEATTIEDIQANNNLNRFQGDGFWHPKTDKAGNATIVVRLLPTPPGEKSPYITRYRHDFTGPTGLKYKEWSLTTVGEKDPVGEDNSKHYNTGGERGQELAKSRSRKHKYLVNLLIIKAPLEPENEGTIVQWQYGRRVQDKILAAMNPKKGFEEDKINPFDILDNGADFIIDIKIDGEYRSYNDCRFKERAALYGGDRAKMKAVLDGKTLPSLAQHLERSKYKTYEELQKRFLEVTGATQSPSTGSASEAIEDDSRPEPRAVAQEEDRRQPANDPAPAANESSQDDNEDDEAYFRKLTGAKG